MLRLLFAALGLALTLSAQAASLKIATLVPDGTSWMKSMRAAGEEIKSRTQGRVKLRFYPGGVMGNDKSVLRKIRAGQLHGSVLTSGGLSALFPDIQIYAFPFMFRSYDEVDYVRGRLDQRLIEGLEKRGFTSFGLSEAGFVYLMSQTPVSSLEEFSQVKMWTPEGDRLARIGLQALGISPIPLPISDVLTGLQTGLIDAVGASPVAAIALQWHTRIKYMTDSPSFYLYGSLVFSNRALGRLSDSDRGILAEVLGRTLQEINHKTRLDNRNARLALLKQGIRLVSPSSEEMEHWRNSVGQAATVMKSHGNFSPQLLNELDRLITEYRSKN